MLSVLRFVLAWIFSLLWGGLALLVVVPLGPERTWRLFARRWGRGVLWLTGVRLDIQGVEHLRGPAIFIVNHMCYIDVAYVPALLPPTSRFVVKRELGKIPLLGWAMRASGALLIDRVRSSQALAIVREGIRRLPAGWSLVVFPEGTRSPDGKLQPFKKGAFYVALKSGLPIVPVGSAGTLDITPRGTVVIQPGVVHVTVGPPISTEGWTHRTLDGHVAEAQAAVERCILESGRRREAASRR